MPKPDLDQTIPRCLFIHSDNLLIPPLVSMLEKNGIDTTVSNVPPSRENWTENVSYVVWLGSPNDSFSEIENFINTAITHNIKMLCLFTLDSWYDSIEKQSQSIHKIADTIEKISTISRGAGDIRTIAFAGLWDSQNNDPKLSIGHQVNQLKQGAISLADDDILYPLEVSVAVERLFSLWFDRGHRNKNILITGSPISGKEIINNIDISKLNRLMKSTYWGIEGGISFSEIIELPASPSFIDYLRQQIQQKLDSTSPNVAPVISPLKHPSTTIREVRKIEKPLSLPKTPTNLNPPRKRGVDRSKQKPLIRNLLIIICIISLLNLPNLNLLIRILFSQFTSIASTEISISSRYQQLTAGSDAVLNSTAQYPLVGGIGNSLVDWANRQQNHLLTLKAQIALARATKHMMSASPGNPFETLQEAKHALDELHIRQSIQNIEVEKREWVNETRRVIDLLPSLIPPDKKITALILLQNNLELRPTGGFIGAVAILTFDHGKLLTFDTRDIYDLDSNLKGLVTPPPELKTYLGESSWYFRDSNWSPNFVESATSANWFLEKEWGSAADIVIGLNLNTLKIMLEATGPITLPNGTIVEANNLLASAFNHQDIPIAKPDAQKQEFLSQLVKPMIDNLIQADSATVIRLLAGLSRAANRGELTLTSSQPAIQSEFIDLGWAGTPENSVCPPTLPEPCQTDSLAINEANVGINKTNFYLTRSIEHAIRLSATEADHSHRITYTNNSPNDTWPGGSYKAFIRVLVPGGTQKLVVAINGLSVSLISTAAAPGFFVEIQPQTTLSVTLDYAVPLPSSYAGYQFFLRKQPGVTGDQLKVSITPPASRTLLPQSVTFPTNPNLPLESPSTTLDYGGIFDRPFSATFSLTP